jgi:lantibiotic modifying enzyme
VSNVFRFEIDKGDSGYVLMLHKEKTVSRDETQTASESHYFNDWDALINKLDNLRKREERRQIERGER